MPASLSLSDALGHALSDKRIDILRQIGQGGSISQAARAVGVSYKAAWQALDQRADAMAQARGAVLARWQADPHAGRAVARLAVRTSMRNQWPCVVQGVQVHGQIVLVHLGLAQAAAGEGACEPPESGRSDGADFLAARITRESAELLGLQPGLVVQALCKATAVRVERAAPGAP
eukprot:gene16616-16432_t